MPSATSTSPSRRVIRRSSSCSGKAMTGSLVAGNPWPDLSGVIRDGRHVLAVRVYYEDTDFSGVVYHASYLRFLERGRTEFLRALGIAHRGVFAGGGADGFHFVLRSMTSEF